MQQAVQAQIIQGDALDVLRTLPAESVQCVVSSPPYFGLRDYGTAEWDGGEEGCDHRQGRPGFTANGTVIDERNQRNRDGVGAMGGDCGKCGATRIDRQIGLESTPAEYVDKMVAVFREVRRVLRGDGVCWLNIGDSYASNPASGGNQSPSMTGGVHKRTPVAGYRRPPELKPKDLCGMPWRLAFALQADGWYLRQDIIWSKPNPMPESVTDRCTKAHEYVFLLSKSERYFYDAAAISEPVSDSFIERWGTERPDRKNPSPQGLIAGSVVGESCFGSSDGTRNKRSVWTITTEPYPEAHFATFPTELPRICILAGTKLGDTVLDPFAGSGTTLQVALELSRAAIGIELNEDYVALANRRLNSTTLGLPLEIAA